MKKEGGEENVYPLQYSCLENPHGQRSLEGYSPWGSKEKQLNDLRTTMILFHYDYLPLYSIIGYVYPSLEIVPHFSCNSTSMNNLKLLYLQFQNLYIIIRS